MIKAALFMPAMRASGQNEGESMNRKGGVFMRVHLPGTGGMTMIENTFIDQLMPAASGDFVKIYLYLLRCVQEGRTDVTVSQVADALNYTEADVKRAMGYWQKLRMLDFDSEENERVPDAAEAKTAGSDSRSTAEEKAVTPAGGKITEFRAKSASREEIRSLIFVAENYLGRLLTPTEQRTLLYFMNDLGMDIDLIDYLLDYCVSKNHTSFHYIQKVAQNWTQKGIRTPEQARLEGDPYRREYFEIFRALGIQNRTPTPAETEFMDRWLDEYGFGTDLICLACERTILQIGKAQFSYTDSILRSWHESEVSSVPDVKKLDQLHMQTVRQVQDRQAASAGRMSAGRFVNFEPSGNDWDDLAMQIMDTQDTESLRKSQES